MKRGTLTQRRTKKRKRYDAYSRTVEPRYVENHRFLDEHHCYCFKRGTFTPSIRLIGLIERVLPIQTQ